MSDGEVQARNGLYGLEFRDTDQRRVPVEERKTYNIKGLWQRHHEIVNLAARGFKQTEIAEILNIDPQTVSNTLNSELGQHKLSEIRLERDTEAKKISEKVRILTNKALAVYHEIFDDQSGEIGLRDKAKVADTVLLELSGLRVPTRVQSQSISATLSTEELREFKERGLKAAREAGLIVDAPERGTLGPRPNDNGEAVTDVEVVKEDGGTKVLPS